MCKHWRKGKCTWGSQYNFSHVGQQDTPRNECHSTNTTDKICRNGSSCTFFARGRCNFFHPTTDKHQQSKRPSRGQTGQGGKQQSERTKCKFGGQCDRVINCPYLHSPQDFPQFNKSKGYQKTNKTNANHSRN